MALAHRLGRIQNTAIGCIGKALKKNRGTYIVMPTGTGKTRVGMKAIEEFSKKRVLWITQTEELIYETIERLEKHFKDKSIGLIKADVFEPNKDIVVASIQTISKADRLGELSKKQFDLIIVDEVHHVVSNSWRTPVEYFTGAKVIGLTATDRRADDMPLSDVVGTKCFDLSYEEAINKRLMAKDNCKVIVTNSVIKGVTTKQADFSPAQLEKLVTSTNRNETIVQSYSKYGIKSVEALGMKPKAICFCVDVLHAQRMALLFRMSGYRSEFLVGSTKLQPPRERVKIYETFKNTHGIDVLCVVNVMNEGKNVPDINIVLMARPTLSPVVYIQQLGRATRWIDDYKDQFIVLDYVDNTGKDFYACNFANTILGGHGGRDFAEHEEEIVLEYYDGPDEIVIDEFRNKLYQSYDNFKSKHQWTKDGAIKAVSIYIEENDSFSVNDLKQKNGLPTRRRVEDLFGSYENLIDKLSELGVELGRPRKFGNVLVNSLEEDDVVRAIKAFAKKKEASGKGTISITDLNSSNGLPSITTVKKFYKNFTELCLKNDINTRFNKWATNERIKKAVIKWEKKKGRKVMYKDLGTTNDLPSMDVIQSRFGGFPQFDKWSHPDTFKPRQKNSERIGVYQRENGNWRAASPHKGMKWDIGTFKTQELAIKAADLLDKKLKGRVLPKEEFLVLRAEIKKEILTTNT